MHHTFLHRNEKPAAEGTAKVNSIRVRPAPTMQVSRAEARINHLSLNKLKPVLLMIVPVRVRCGARFIDTFGFLDSAVAMRPLFPRGQQTGYS